MASFITTISIPQEMAHFCTEKNLSLSKELQKRVQELIDLDSINLKNLEDLQRKIAFLQNTVSKQRDFIESKGLMDSFLGL